MEDEQDRAFGRVRERLAKLETQMDGALDGEDARTLMEFARSEDHKVLGTVMDRLNEFRNETRTLFKHSDTEHSAALYKAVTESESRIMAAIKEATRPSPLPPVSVGSLAAKHTPLVLALAGLFLAIASGNPQWLHFGMGG